MPFTTIKIAGTETLARLTELRERYPETGEYPFLVGAAEELERLQESAEFNDQDPREIVQASLDVDVAKWIRKRQSEAEAYGFGGDETLGQWPGEITEKGSISLHTDILSGNIKPEVQIGLATIDEPWQLPAVLKYGGWNDCPDPEVHCAFHRKWGEEFGAEITGMSGDVVECSVAHPPRDQEAAIALAWEQYWYCYDIVEQGCESISNLAANLLNSPYWYFWWD